VAAANSLAFSQKRRPKKERPGSGVGITILFSKPGGKLGGRRLQSGEGSKQEGRGIQSATGKEV